MDKISKRIVFFLIFLLFFLPSSINAQNILGYLFSSALKLYEAGVLFIFFLKLLIIVGSVLNGVVATLIPRLLAPRFVPWSYTRPTDNPIIEAGLNITQGFISIGLVLALIWIAFATILRLEGYNTKKLFVKLIIVAMFVYFAPVICGLIVDATNIFMYYFTDKIVGIGVFTNTLISVGRQILEALIAIVNPLAWPRLITESIILIFVQFYLFLLLLSFALLFLFRYAAIWLAVILSPIAFICSILPITRKYWNFWWENFIRWSLAGPITAFFLYLGAKTATIVNTAEFWKQIASYFTGYLQLHVIIAHFVTLGILQLGLLLGVQGAGFGGKLVVKWAQRGAGYVRSKFEKYGARPADLWQRARRGAESLTETLLGRERSERYRTAMQQLATRWATERRTYRGVPVEEITGVRGIWARIATAPWAVRRRIGMRLGPGAIESDRLEVSRIEEEIVRRGLEAQIAALRGAKTDLERLAIFRAIIRSGNLDRALRQGYLTGSEALGLAESLYSRAESIGRSDLLRASFPEVARNYLASLPPGIPGAPPPPPPGVHPDLHYAQQVLSRLRPSDFEAMSERVLGDRLFLEALIRRGTPEQFEAFIRRFGPRGAEVFTQEVVNLSLIHGVPPAQFLENANPNLHAYLRRAGRASRLLVPWLAP